MAYANSYQNPWHKPHDATYGTAQYQNNGKVICEYRGFQVIRVHDRHYDYVYKGKCVTQRAGASDPKPVIDGILDGTDRLSKIH